MSSSAKRAKQGYGLVILLCPDGEGRREIGDDCCACDASIGMTSCGWDEDATCALSGERAAARGPSTLIASWVVRCHATFRTKFQVPWTPIAKSSM